MWRNTRVPLSRIFHKYLPWVLGSDKIIGNYRGWLVREMQLLPHSLSDLIVSAHHLFAAEPQMCHPSSVKRDCAIGEHGGVTVVGLLLSVRLQPNV